MGLKEDLVIGQGRSRRSDKAGRIATLLLELCFILLALLLATCTGFSEFLDEDEKGDHHRTSCDVPS